MTAMASDEYFDDDIADAESCWLPPVAPRVSSDDQSDSDSDHRYERYRHRRHGWTDEQAWRAGFIGDADYAFLLISPHVSCFSEDGRPMVEISWNKRSMTLQMEDRRLSAIIDGLFWGHADKHLSSAARHTVLRILTNEAVMAPAQAMELRTALTADGQVCIDLGRGQVATFDKGLALTSDAPVRFRPAPPLPTPQGPPNLMRLRDYLNVDDDGFQLIIAWLTFSLLPFGPYPVLHLIGQHGAAKSTISRFLRYLLDGRFTPGGGRPDEMRVLDVRARHQHGLFFDNQSNLPDPVADKICRMATGGDDSRRANYSDDRLIAFEARRPVVITSIVNIITQADLADRALVIELNPVREKGFRTEAELHGAFKHDAPQIMSGILHLIADGLTNRPLTPASDLPRMADFAHWALAIEPVFWNPGSFMAAFARNHDASANDILEDDPVALGIFALLDAQAGFWQGTASELLVEIRTLLDRRGQHRHAIMPRQPRSLSERLTRLEPELRKKGIAVSRQRVTAASVKQIIIQRLNG